MKQNTVYLVEKAERLNVYHYHGSWFEYTWKVTMKDEFGKTIEGEFDTWRHYMSLDGMYIRCNNANGIFEDTLPYTECDEREATHVEILPNAYNHNEMSGVTIGKIYKIQSDDEDDEMIRADNGDLLCDFPLYLKVKWLKEIQFKKTESLS